METTHLSLSACDMEFLEDSDVHGVISSGAFANVTSLSLNACTIPGGVRAHLPHLSAVELNDVNGTSSSLTDLLSGLASLDLVSFFPPDVVIGGTCCEHEGKDKEGEWANVGPCDGD